MFPEPYGVRVVVLRLVGPHTLFFSAFRTVTVSPHGPMTSLQTWTVTTFIVSGMNSFPWSRPQIQSRVVVYSHTQTCHCCISGVSCQQIRILACSIPCWIKALMSVLLPAARVVISSTMKVGLQGESLLSVQDGFLCFLVVKMGSVLSNRILSVWWATKSRNTSLLWVPLGPP